MDLFHIEFYPSNRTEKNLKYLTGWEIGTGAFIGDVPPEPSAEKLREAVGCALW